MARPTNAELLAREPEIEAGTELAVAAVVLEYPDAKVIEAEIKEDLTMEVTVGWVDAAGATHILEVMCDAAGEITGSEERPEVPPGKAKSLKERKPHAKVKTSKKRR